MTPRPAFGDDDPPPGRDRGVSSTVGFVLVLGFLLIGFTIYQGIVVPEQNRHVEFDHSQSVQSQVVDLRSAIGSAATGTGGSVSIEPGANYPRRTLANNLGASVGQVRTQRADSGVLIENVTAVDDETADYFGDGATRLGPFETSSVRYEPKYLWYTNAPTTVYENTVAFNDFGDGTSIPLTDQSIVDGRRITLIAVNGSLAEAQSGTVSVDVEALSASSERVAVRNTSGGRLNVTIPTERSAADWRELLADEMNASPNDGRYVESVEDTGDGQVSIVLEGGVTYDLRLAKVGVGSRTAEEDAHYVTDVSGNGTSLAEGGTRKLVVEVRDRFNNPVSNVTVESSIERSAGSGDRLKPASDTTDARGRAAFTYHAPDDVDGTQDAEVTVFFNSTALDREKATFDVSVLDADGSGGGCSGPGTGSTSSWCSGTNTTVTQPGGVVSGIGSASHINVSDPSFTSLRPEEGQMDAGAEYFRMAFVVEEDVEDATGTTRYMFVVPEGRGGFTQSLGDSNVNVQNRRVTIYKDDSFNADGTGYTAFVDLDLKGNDLNDWYEGDLVIDLLDASHYSGNPSSQLAEIRNFVRNNEVRIYVVDMDGRVELSVE